MSFKLDITNPDGTHYWTEFFNDKESADKWLEEEKTRPYWNVGNTYEILEEAKHVATQEEIQAEDDSKVKIKKIKDAKDALKNIDIDGATTIAKLKVIVKLLLEAQSE